jgi:hypothetical protein
MGEATGQCGPTAAAQLAQDAGVKNWLWFTLDLTYLIPKQQNKQLKTQKAFSTGK